MQSISFAKLKNAHDRMFYRAKHPIFLNPHQQNYFFLVPRQQPYRPVPFAPVVSQPHDLNPPQNRAHQQKPNLTQAHIVCIPPEFCN